MSQGYTSPLYVIHFKGGLNSGKAQVYIFKSGLFRPPYFSTTIIVGLALVLLMNTSLRRENAHCSMMVIPGVESDDAWCIKMAFVGETM